MISTRDGAALYLKTRRVGPTRIGTGLGCAMRVPRLVYTPEFTARSRAPRFAGRAYRNTIPHQSGARG